MKSLSRACLALLLLCAPLWAAGAASTSANVAAKSDRVEIVLQSSAPMTFKEKMISSSVLAVEVSPAVLKPGTAKKVAVDKGLIQNVTFEQHGNAVTVKLAVISRPKLIKGNLESGGRKLTLIYSTADIASSKPSGFSSLDPNQGSKPASHPRVSSQPVPAIRPSSPTPTSSNTVPVRPLSPTVSSSTPTTPPTQPVTSPPATAMNGVPRINLTFSNASLTDVLARIADQAGLNPQLSPDIDGTFSGALTNLPLDQALKTVCQGQNVTWQVLNGSLVVNASPGGAPGVPSVSTVPPASTPEVASVPDPVLPAGPLAREYYPIRNKSAAEVVTSARSLLPNIRYTIDERLNIVMAEGSATDIERLSGFLKEVSAK